jgi:hypothetical protein
MLKLFSLCHPSTLHAHFCNYLFVQGIKILKIIIKIYPSKFRWAPFGATPFCYSCVTSHYLKQLCIPVPFTDGRRLSLPNVIGYLMPLAHLCCDDSHLLLLLPPDLFLLTLRPPSASSLWNGRLIWEGREWNLGASKRAWVAHNWGDIQAG